MELLISTCLWSVCVECCEMKRIIVHKRIYDRCKGWVIVLFVTYSNRMHSTNIKKMNRGWFLSQQVTGASHLFPQEISTMWRYVAIRDWKHCREVTVSTGSFKHPPLIPSSTCGTIPPPRLSHLLQTVVQSVSQLLELLFIPRLFYSDQGGDKFLCNVGYKIHIVAHSTRWHSS
jgi:hypothetical protein